jgi:tRNA(fMet)-specific endonuclease VapC
MNKIILDTNAYTRFLTGDEQVFETLGKAETVYLSVIVVAELLVGFKGGNKRAENQRLLENFLHKSTVQILNITTETAEIFSDLQQALRKTGHPIPINDVWIASGAVETGSVLITYDNHFRQVPGIRLWDWE